MFAILSGITFCLLNACLNTDRLVSNLEGLALKSTLRLLGLFSRFNYCRAHPFLIFCKGFFLLRVSVIFLKLLIVDTLLPFVNRITIIADAFLAFLEPTFGTPYAVVPVTAKLSVASL